MRGVSGQGLDSQGAVPEMQGKTTKVVLIVTTVLWLLAGLLGSVLAMFSVMMFDAPGSENNPGTIALFFSTSTFPLVCLLSIASSWILYRRQRFTIACWLACLPLLNVIADVAAIVWLEVYCGGQFAG
jgi:hypothetical protein